jgi:uncharacterized membrane protein
MNDNQTPRPPSPAGPTPPRHSQVDSAISRYANNLVLWIARHWLAIFNSAWGLYVLLPILAPTFMQLGFVTPARIIYGVYSFACHQLPDHSYFLFGNTLAPLMPDLERAGLPSGLNIFDFRAFIGNEQIGYKVALCQRDMAIYVTVFLSGIAFALVRNRLAPLSLRYYLLFLIPIALDGGSQLFGLRESNWWLRTLTGAIFGAASIWMAYPYVDDAMQDVIETETRQQPHPQ